MQFIVLARDDTAEGTSERRAGARAEHLARVREVVAAGNLIDGGAITNDREQVTGSVLTCQFETREALERWIANDVYKRQGVWRAVEALNLQRMNPAALKG